MAVTVTSYRVVPFQFFTLPLWAVERFTAVNDVETTKDTVAIFWLQVDARDALTLPGYQTTRWED